MSIGKKHSARKRAGRNNLISAWLSYFHIIYRWYIYDEYELGSSNQHRLDSRLTESSEKNDDLAIFSVNTKGLYDFKRKID